MAAQISQVNDQIGKKSKVSLRLDNLNAFDVHTYFHQLTINQSLTELKIICHTKIEDVNDYLIDLLAQQSNIRCLDLSSIELPNQNFNQLIDQLISYPALTEFHLMIGSFSGQMIIRIFDLIQLNSSLRSFHLIGFHLPKYFLIHLLESLKVNRSIRHLNLQCSIDDSAVIYFVNHLKLTAIVELVTPHVGNRSLFNHLNKLTQLTHLTIHEYVSAECLTHLANFVSQQTNLTYLSLRCDAATNLSCLIAAVQRNLLTCSIRLINQSTHPHQQADQIQQIMLRNRRLQVEGWTIQNHVHYPDLHASIQSIFLLRSIDPSLSLLPNEILFLIFNCLCGSKLKVI